MSQLILASSSPRRFELMQKLGVPFTVEVSHVDEDLSLHVPPEKLAQELSKQKAHAIAQKHTDAIIIGADTIVVIDGQVLGKPKSIAEGKAMLRRLSGKTHQVITGVTVINCLTKRTMTFSETTLVTFRILTDEEIARYIREINIFDKAGAYAIQEGTTTVVDHFDGDYENIVGLPIKAVSVVLGQIGFSSNSPQLTSAPK